MDSIEKMSLLFKVVVVATVLLLWTVIVMVVAPDVVRIFDGAVSNEDFMGIFIRIVFRGTIGVLATFMLLVMYIKYIERVEAEADRAGRGGGTEEGGS